MILYSALMPVYMVNVILTCYISVLQSKSIGECNSRFHASLREDWTFGSNDNNYSEERIERERAARRERFYREYAD